MKAYSLIVLAAFIEGVIISHFSVGVVLPLTCIVLIWVSSDLSLDRLLIASVIAGTILDSARASTYAPYWSMSLFIVAIFVGLWRRQLRDSVNDRRYLIRMYAPVVVVSASVLTLVPYMTVLPALSLAFVVYELTVRVGLLAIGLILIRSLNKRYV